MKVSRAVTLLSMMPRHLTVEDTSYDEMVTLWDFLSTEHRMSITYTALRIQLAKELDVYVETLDEAIGENHLAEVLAWEASSKSFGTTIEEVVSLLRNVRSTITSDWIIPLCHILDYTESELVWRWALRHRWLRVRNLMGRWLRKTTGLDTTVPTMLDVAFGIVSSDGLKRVGSEMPSLRRWEGGEPELCWFISDLSTLVRVDPGIVRHRNGLIHHDYTPLAPDELDPCWSWVNPLGTDRWHSSTTPLPFSTPKEPLPATWAEAQPLLNQHARSGFLILHGGEYFIYTSGTASLNAVILSLRKNDRVGYVLSAGFLDGDEVVDAVEIETQTLSFAMQQGLRRRGVHPSIRHAVQPVETPLIVRLEYAWTPKEGWHFRIEEVLEEAGLSTDVDGIVDYMMLVGSDE